MSHRNLPRKKRNIIWKISREQLELAFNKSSTFADILSNLGLAKSSRNYKIIQDRLSIENIDWSNIRTGLDTNKGRKFSSKPKIELSEILIVGSTFSRNSLKKRLLRESLLKNECYICGQGPEWNNKPLVLQIDHINGIRNDNRLENLRILCPHCHTQTDTFSGKNNKRNN
jgi:5-methylcytosine-specific restriction endonuclease McrA